MNHNIKPQKKPIIGPAKNDITKNSLKSFLLLYLIISRTCEIEKGMPSKGNNMYLNQTGWISSKPPPSIATNHIELNMMKYNFRNLFGKIQVFLCILSFSNMYNSVSCSVSVSRSIELTISSKEFDLFKLNSRIKI